MVEKLSESITTLTLKRELQQRIAVVLGYSNFRFITCRQGPRLYGENSKGQRKSIPNWLRTIDQMYELWVSEKFLVVQLSRSEPKTGFVTWEAMACDTSTPSGRCPRVTMTEEEGGTGPIVLALAYLAVKE